MIEAEQQTLGMWLYRRRSALGLSVMEVASRAQLSGSYISNLEHDRGNPTLDALRAIAASLDVEVTDMPLDAKRESSPESEGYLSTAELAEFSGASLREVDYWSRCGYLPCSLPAVGSGSRRFFSKREALLARLFRQMKTALLDDSEGTGWPLAKVAVAAAELTEQELRSGSGRQLPLSDRCCLSVADLSLSTYERIQLHEGEPE